jgi:hypothetical protein
MQLVLAELPATILTVRVGHISSLVCPPDLIAIASSNEGNAASIAERGKGFAPEPIGCWLGRAT